MTRNWVVLLVLVSACRTAPEGPREVEKDGPAPAKTSVGEQRPSPEKPEPAAAPEPIEPRAPTEQELRAFRWLTPDDRIRPLMDVFEPPPGYERVDLKMGSFGSWLRVLPLKKEGSPVLTYRGDVLHPASDPRIAAVVEIDIGTADLQQCADSVIRMHGEWRWATEQTSDLGYYFLSGDYASWPAYAQGQRPKVSGPKVTWVSGASPDTSRKAFRRYLDMVFTYASTISLARQRTKIERSELAPGDFVVLPGSPGHAVLILDVVKKGDSQLALLGQGFMPAQSFQVLAHGGDPWFSLDGDALDTPFWSPFPWSALRRMEPTSK